MTTKECPHQLALKEYPFRSLDILFLSFEAPTDTPDNVMLVAF